MSSEPIAFGVMLLIVLGPLLISTARDRGRHRRARRVALVIGGPIPPLHVRLIPDTAPPPRMERQAREFERLGFVRVGAYRIEGTSVRQIALLGDGGTLLAEVQTGTLFGDAMTVARVSTAGEIVSADTRPPFAGMPTWYRGLSMRRASPARLVARMRGEVLLGAPIVIAAEGYVAFSEREHRRMSEWTLRFGALRPHMIPRLERLTGMTAETEAAEFLRRAHEGDGAYPRD